jgi:hypothetical protein
VCDHMLWWWSTWNLHIVLGTACYIVCILGTAHYIDCILGTACYINSLLCTPCYIVCILGTACYIKCIQGTACYIVCILGLACYKVYFHGLCHVVYIISFCFKIKWVFSFFGKTSLSKTGKEGKAANGIKGVKDLWSDEGCEGGVCVTTCCVVEHMEPVISHHFTPC